MTAVLLPSLPFRWDVPSGYMALDEIVLPVFTIA